MAVADGKDFMHAVGFGNNNVLSKLYNKNVDWTIEMFSMYQIWDS